MGSRVIHSDLELFLTGFIRRELAALPGQPFPGGFVSNEFWAPGENTPADPPPFQIIVRDDSGPRTGVITKSPSVGITVLGSDALDKADTTNLALLVYALIEDSARVEQGNPVAAVVNANGPFKVADDSGKPRRYMTFDLSVVGSAFP